MAVRKYKPTSNGRRNMSVLTYDEITMPVVTIQVE